MDQFSLNHLNDVEFEQFCFDLLQALGFTNMDWRKGTGLTSSPADSGRDIECSHLIHLVGGEQYLEKWFVDCKHYQKGVPVEAISGSIAWAEAERPDVLLLIASNFFSNSTKKYLATYKESNRPSFKILYWELPTLEKLAATHSILLRKYRISGEFPFLAIMHPTHIASLRDMPINSLKYFFDCLDELPAKKRDAMFGSAYFFLIHPRFHRPVTGYETMEELRIDRVDYFAFKQRCYQIVQTGLLLEMLLVHLIVSSTLDELFRLGDTTSIDTAMLRMAKIAESFRRHSEESPEERDFLLDMAEDAARRREQMPQVTTECYELYTYFCEHVLEKLRLEEHLWTYEATEEELEAYERFLKDYRKKKA